tara:strand:+ start:338 stop:559 length:222 start_codon:yes stop_codon:yes gene_type:complete
MKKKLKTLTENNADAFSFTRVDFNAPQLNGIACPKCGSELFDSQPNVILTSHPAQKNTKCSSKKCDYSGYRFI